MRERARRALSIVAIASALIAHAQAARAQTSEANSFAPGRTLGGHTFFPTEVVPWPFVDTPVLLATGAGVWQFDAQDSGLAGQPTTTQHGFFATFTHANDLQVAICRRLAVSAGTLASLIGGDGLVGAKDVGFEVAF